ncbi:coiled-coil domain-containing protein 9B [Brachionichthys hirsutus]|uniref:coiled-coil domain-containing protein 9B n=1 Tax=Brachionichthys hirsutus TaxID=412623 RepID=UPI0036049BCD
MPKRDDERDLELDRKIEALRRKNKALMKRYKEVEEDRRRAEEEGMALQSRKGKADDLTITISKSNSDNRVVVTKLFNSVSAAGKGQQDTESEGGGEGPPQGTGRGQRKQLMVTMAGKKGKRVVSERPERRPGSADVKSATDDGQVEVVESAAGGAKQPPHVTQRDTTAQVKQGQKHTEEHHRLSEPCQELETPHAGTDLNIPTLREEQEEYLRWKKEREQIDRERVARHKNARGQWTRAWDMDKTDTMFSEKSLPDRDWGPSSRGGRNARKGQSRTGHDKRSKVKGAKNVQVMSSKAKGIDRLTGRARRWEGNEGENQKTSDTTLEEFLEELDALTGEAEDRKDQDSAPVSAANLREDSPPQEAAETSSPRSSDKKVRFSDELVRVAHARQNAGPQVSESSEARSPGGKKTSSPKKKQGPQQPLESAKEDQGGPPPAPLLSECTRTDSNVPTDPSSCSPDRACGALQERAVQPAELAKCDTSNKNTGMQ